MIMKRCKYRSLLNPFKIKIEIRGHRIHHVYAGGVMFAIGELGISTMPIFAPYFASLSFSGIVTTIDDILAHIRNWANGVKD